ncbi:MAG: hypothetical protein ACLR06_02265 [Christensenellaceae bacterium]
MLRRSRYFFNGHKLPARANGTKREAIWYNELRKNIRFGNYLLKIVSNIQKKGNRVYIEFVGLPTLVIKKAEIIEWESVCCTEQDGVYPAKIKPIATTTAKAVEVARHEDKYELHFLMCNESSEGKLLVWNFTVSGSDIDSEGEYVIPPKF